MEEEIWSLVPKEKLNKLKSKIEEPITIWNLIIYGILGIGIVVLTIVIFVISKKKKK